MTVIRCPRCPVCHTPPEFVYSPVQAFCSNDDCPALSWNMTITAQANLDGVNYITLDPPGDTVA